MQEDIALCPGANADPNDEVNLCIHHTVLERYDVYSYRHAAAIMKYSFTNELAEVEEALLHFNMTIDDIARPGGNESVIPKKIAAQLRPAGWYETRIQGNLVVRLFE